MLGVGVVLSPASPAPVWRLHCWRLLSAECCCWASHNLTSVSPHWPGPSLLPTSCSLLTPVLMAAPQKTGGCCSASAMRVTSPAAREFLAECGGQHQHSCGVCVVIRLSSSRNLPPGGVRLRVHRPEHALPRRQGRLLLHQLGVGIYIYHCWSCFSGNVDVLT